MKRCLVLAMAAATALLSLGFAGASSTSSVAAAASRFDVARAPMTGSVPRDGVPTINQNWSGYVVTSHRRFRYVEARFVQPHVRCSGKANRWTSNWVGLDGFRSGTIEQAGTASFCSGRKNAKAQYLAWWEMFPAGSVVVFHVRPGDMIDASVAYTRGKFLLRVHDVSSHRSATKTVSCRRCQRSSAEWIIERPALCNNKGAHCILSALADFGTTRMRDARAITRGRARGITTFANYHRIFMVQRLRLGGFISLDSVGRVDRRSQSFVVRYERSGWTIPTRLGPHL